METLLYNIAGHPVEIHSQNSAIIKRKLPEFNIFGTNLSSPEPILNFYLDKAVSEQSDDEIIDKFDLEQDKCILYKNRQGYHFIIKDVLGNTLCSMTNDFNSSRVECSLKSDTFCNHNHLRFSLWIAMALVGISKKTIAIHSSVIILRSSAILFLGESGTGKSTQTKLWTENVTESKILNDDSPFVRIEDGVPYVYGSPWSGKGRCYINEKYPIKAIIRLKQAEFNKIKSRILLNLSGQSGHRAPHLLLE